MILRYPVIYIAERERERECLCVNRNNSMKGNGKKDIKPIFCGKRIIIRFIFSKDRFMHTKKKKMDDQKNI